MEKEKVFKEICEVVAQGIIRDAETKQNTEKLIELFNQYEEDEHDGVDYIFDINKPEDLKCCIDGGMTAFDIAQLHKSGVNLFNFGVNYKEPTPVAMSHVQQGVINCSYEIAENVVKFATRDKNYAWAYETYVVPNK